MRQRIFIRMWRFIKQDKLNKSQALLKSWAIEKKRITIITPKEDGILETWNGNRLKNKGKRNAHHYRRDGRLYIVVRKQGIIEHKLTDVLYKTINNSTCPLSSRMSKNATPKLDMVLTKNYLAYKKHNKLTKKVL